MKREAGPRPPGLWQGHPAPLPSVPLPCPASLFPATVLAQVALATLSKVFTALPIFLLPSSPSLLLRRILSPSYPFSRGKHLNWSLTKR